MNLDIHLFLGFLFLLKYKKLNIIYIFTIVQDKYLSQNPNLYKSELNIKFQTTKKRFPVRKKRQTQFNKKPTFPHWEAHPFPDIPCSDQHGIFFFSRNESVVILFIMILTSNTLYVNMAEIFYTFIFLIIFRYLL